MHVNHSARTHFGLGELLEPLHEQESWQLQVHSAASTMTAAAIVLLEVIFFREERWLILLNTKGSL